VTRQSRPNKRVKLRSVRRSSSAIRSAAPALGSALMTALHSQALKRSVAGSLTVVAVVSQALGRTLTAQLPHAFKVPADGMAPTLRIGDFVLVSERFRAKPAPLPALGTIVEFRSIETQGLLIVKRVVGLPQDTLLMRSDTLFRNARRVPEPYAFLAPIPETPDTAWQNRMKKWQLPYLARTPSRAYRPDSHTWGPIVVPPNEVFLLGDNRNQSYDSRFYGFVSVDSLIGEVLEIYWSWDDSTHRVRTERIGTRPH